MTWAGYPTSSRYLRYQGRSNDWAQLGTGYIVIEYIEEPQGEMLSKTWYQKHNDPVLRNNLFRDLARINLDMTRLHLPRIGSFIIEDNGCLSLSNRPLCLEIQDLENENVPVDIPRDYTYSSVDSYVTDILAFHDSRLQHQPNAVNDGEDCIYQMSALTMMRTMSSHFSGDSSVEGLSFSA